MRSMTTMSVIKPAAQASRQLLCRNIATSSKARVNFNSKHLANGDPLPPYNGKLRMFNMRFCPFAQRTMLALIAKDIEFDLVNVNLKNKPDWLFKKSAFGKVPALEIEENVTIFESLPTVEYLDDVYPNRRLLPKNPLEKAHAKMIVEATGSIHNLFVKLVKKPEYITENNIQAFLKSLDFIQDELIRRGTKFLHGNEPGYSDYMIWPWFERLHSTEDIDPRATINRQNYGTLIKYINNMMQDPAVSEYLVPVEILKKFHYGFQDTNGPYYDLIAEH